MSLINGISRAAYAAGDYYAKSAQADQAAATQRSATQYQAQLQQERDQRLEEAKNAPLNRITALARTKMTEEVPVEAEPVTAVSGVNDQGEKFGFKGDIEKMRASINALPDGEDKTKAMAQLDAQVSQDTARANSLVNGKTRKRTADEALAAAVDEAKTTDLPALAAYETQIGKPARDERRVANQETKEENRFNAATEAEKRRAQTDARKAEIDLRKLDLQQGSLDSQNRRIDALIAHWDRSDDAKDVKAEGKTATPERLYSIVNAMNATIKNLNDGSRGKTPDEKAAWQQQYDTAVRVRDRASGLLDANLSERGAPDSSAKPAPAGKTTAPAIPSLPTGAKQIGTSGGKPVYETPDGKRFIQK
jgi:hypothetical protein